VTAPKVVWADIWQEERSAAVKAALGRPLDRRGRSAPCATTSGRSNSLREPRQRRRHRRIVVNAEPNGGPDD
jgi:hypothetical protein